MPSIGIDANEADVLRVAAEMTNKAARLGAEAFNTTRKFGLLLQGRIQARASGRPGPRAVTGDYRRSWSTIVSTRGLEVVADVGTSAPQGRRLEYGFSGVDALGRSYNQPPYPHAKPALDEIGPVFTLAIGELGEFPK